MTMVQSGRGKKSHHPKHKNKNNLVGLLSIGATIAMLGGAAIPVYQGTQEPTVNIETSCLEGKINSLTVFVIDQTNKMAHSYQTTHIKKTIRNMINDMAGGASEQVAFYFIHQEGGKPLDYLFRRCVPMRGKDASFINSNAAMVDADYHKVFWKPVQAILNKIDKFNLSNTSAILSEVKNIVVRAKSDGITKLRLVVFSDFLNNSEAFSHYKKHVKQHVNQKRFLASQEAEGLRTDMRGVTIDAHYLYQNKWFGRAKQTEAHQIFWKDWFTSNKVAEFFITKL